MRRRITSLWPQFFIFFVVLSFFVRLYFPPSIFVTPDFGRSDLLHLNLPNKFVLSQNLRSFKFPLWQNNIAQGYPIFSEAITGTFFIPNIIIFSALPFEIAIPTLYLVTFLISALGMYSLLRSLNINEYSSIFGAVSFTFSAAMVLRISHLGVIQTISLLPLTLMFVIFFLKKTSLKNFLVLSFLFSQFLLVGFAQIFVYAIFLFTSLIFLYAILKTKKNFIKSFLLFCLILIFTFSLSAIQLLPAVELTQYSIREKGVNPSTILNSIPMKINNLKTYINPFILGSAKNGTYNSTNWQNTGIFWENTTYIGLLPISLSLFGVFYLTFQKKKDKLFFTIVILTAITLLLSLGTLAPTHILFSFPPLSFFRVPARFNLFTQFFLVILAAYTLNLFSKKMSSRPKFIFFLLVISLTTFDLFSKWWSYHPIGKSKEWLAPPESFYKLDKNFKDYRIAKIGENTWNNIFVKNGWENQSEYYKFFLNSLEENYNVFFDLNQLNGYVVLPTKRFNLEQSIMLEAAKSDSGLELSSSFKKLLDSQNVRYLLSSQEIKNNDYSKIFETEKDNFKYYIYESSSYLPKFSIYYSFQTVNSIQDYFQKYKEIDPTKTVLLEKNIKLDLEESAGEVKVNKNLEGEYDLLVTTQKPGILVVSDSFYPGWKAKIDGEKTEILPANVNSKAIFLPEGKHHVNFSFKPFSFNLGLIISLASHLILLFLLLRTKKAFRRNETHI
ncbi:hypothetical protein A2870_03645 [Candidatus Curtissbacteria bacterium RIFCSPHIGHO2_01_FULL_41_11]|uniref:Membrane protein 6-pyruvoyl-tetrahydropterin synthase-related domain-containing protein n=1 Tax=Candidatus Curtissbacteria bacterium RIFCSPHIGHO2_01_FULL_41_11 TaxID=1797711 RepID=A0A1F5G5X4_9BACT|nr:MAG: hypothetical protein A2870_03645 [Candidatus Curtissbacteria bacterium RIFCSPHIGHO2_01_FULL_41_11]